MANNYITDEPNISASFESLQYPRQRSGIFPHLICYGLGYPWLRKNKSPDWWCEKKNEPQEERINFKRRYFSSRSSAKSLAKGWRACRITFFPLSLRISLCCLLTLSTFAQAADKSHNHRRKFVNKSFKNPSSRFCRGKTDKDFCFPGRIGGV